jgi:hypothetical protein
MALYKNARFPPGQRGYAQSSLWRRNPTKTLGFLLPWFFPWFFVGFLLSPPPYAQSFLRNQAFLFWRIFFLGFLNPSNCLVFLELLTFCNKDQMEILLFIYIFSKLTIAKKIFKHISDSEI